MLPRREQLGREANNNNNNNRENELSVEMMVERLR